MSQSLHPLLNAQNRPTSYGPGVDLMGIAEVAELFGVTTARVHQLTATRGFPEPVAVLAAGRIWKGADIRRWARRNGRLT